MPKFDTFKFGTDKFGTYAATVADPPALTTAGGASRRDDYIRMPSGKVVVLSHGLTAGDQALKDTITASLTGAGGTLVRGTDVITQALKDALESHIVTYDLKFFIMDNNQRWVDFTDRGEWRGRNQLRKVGSLTYSSQRLRGELQQKLSSVTLDNSDGFWERPLPAELKASYDENFKQVYDSSNNRPYAASFSVSAGGKESAFFRRKAALRVEFLLAGDEQPNVVTLGIFIIEDIRTNNQDKSATLRLAPLSNALTESRAGNVKNGTTPYMNRSPHFLTRELLRKVYNGTDTSGNDTGDIPSSWFIQNDTSFDVPEDSTSAWVSSSFGRPPEAYSDSTGTDQGWADSHGRICRAMVAWEYTTGTIATTVGSTTITGTSTSWSSSTSDLHNKIKVGDALIIGKQYTSGDNASSDGNNGYFTISAINSATSITLDRPVEGSADETGLKYSIVRVYMGLDNSLWEYNIATDRHRELTNSSTNPLDTTNGYKIRRLWVNTGDTDYPIYGAAVKSDPSEAFELGCKVFKFRWNGTTPEFSVTATIGESSNRFYMGDTFVREADQIRHSPTLYNYKIGKWHEDTAYQDGSIDQVPITIPFEQTLSQCYDNYGKTINVYKQQSTDTKTAYAVEQTINNTSNAKDVDIVDVRDAGVNEGHWSVEGEPKTNAIPNSPTSYYIRVKYTYGQQGFLILNPDAGTKGTIYYCRADDTSSGTFGSIDLGDGTSTDEDDILERTYTIYAYDINANSHTALSGFATDVNKAVPTAVCLGSTNDSNGNKPIYIAFHELGVNERYDSATYGANSKTHLYRLGYTESGGTVTHNYKRLLEYTNIAAGGGSAADPEQLCVLEMVEGVASNNNSRLCMSALQAENIDTDQTSSPAYRMWVYDDAATENSTATVLNGYRRSQYRPTGLAYVNLGGSSNDRRVMFLEDKTGQLKTHDMSDSTESGQSIFQTISNLPAVNTEFSTITPIVWLQNIKHAFWISSPTPSPLRSEMVNGKYYLSKWAPTYPARVEFADFSKMNTWEALGYLAEIADCNYGFNPDGTFFFKRKPSHKNSAYTFTSVGANKLISIDKGRGQKEIVNHATRIPSMAIIGDIKIHVDVINASDYGKETNDRHTLSAIQRDMDRKSIILSCIQGGRIPTSTDTIHVKRSLAKFKFKITEPKIETSLRATYSASSYVVKTIDAEGTRLGSALTVEGDDGAKDTALVGMLLRFGSNDTDIIETHDAAWPAGASGEATFPINEIQTYIDVRKHNTNSPITDGSIDLTADIQNLSRPLKFGDVIAVGDLTRQSADTRIEYMTIQSIDNANKRIHVIRNSQFNTGPVQHRPDEDIYLIRNGSEVYLNAPLSGSTSYALGDSVVIDTPLNDKDSLLLPTNVFDNSFVHSDRYDVAEFQPILGEYTPIGGLNTPYTTNVDLRFSIDTTANNKELKFSEGDMVRIECQGMTLEQDTGSAQVAADSVSVNKWGKRESQLRDNPFANILQSQWNAQREVRNNKDPKYTLTVSTLLAPWINLMDVVTLQDQEVLPRSKQFSEDCYISNISFNPQTNGLMNLTLRSIDSY